MRSASLVLLALCGWAAALDNGLSRLPPMGWMSWTAFYCEMDCQKHPHACINEQLYMDMADRMAADGYRDAGYLGVHVDDCWMERQRDKNGKLVSDRKRFPSGMLGLSRYMHERGLHFGIYEDYGTKTCAGFPGSYGFIQIDADSFAEWEVDYLKLDGCNIDTKMYPVGYPEMTRALNKTGRPIVYSCSWPAYMIDQPDLVNYTVIGENCNLWRNFDDINSSWGSILSIISYYDRNQDKHIPTHGPGAWHDPDMLVIGNAGITAGMSRAQMAVWCAWSAPLIMSNDLRAIAREQADILLNRRAIAVDQDPMGKMARLVANTTDIGVYVKPMTPVKDGETSYAFVVLNRSEKRDNKVEFVFEHVGLKASAGYELTDVWSGKSLGVVHPSDTYSVTVPAADAAFVTATLVGA